MTSQRSDVRLADWFQQGARALPWREDASFYRVWISEIMLQQTQVVTVIPYFEKFMQLFPTVQALAIAEEESVMKAWAGLGYYSRARNLQKGARALTARLLSGGDWPRTRAEWLEISGVGPYTAGAILSIAGHQPEALLDGNVERVLSRFFAVDRAERTDRAEGDTAYKQQLWNLSRAWVEGAYARKIDPSVTNQALMELGARVCVPREPRCGICPISNACEARLQERVSEFPPKKARAAFLDVQETALCFLNAKGQVLLEKSRAWRTGLWDLPLVGNLPLGKKIPKVFQKSGQKFGQKSDLKIKKTLGEVITKHVVTRHRITRKTVIVKVPTLQEKGIQNIADPSHSQWISLKRAISENPEVALGSAAVKTLRAVSEAIEAVGVLPPQRR